MGTNWARAITKFVEGIESNLVDFETKILKYSQAIHIGMLVFRKTTSMVTSKLLGGRGFYCS